MPEPLECVRKARFRGTNFDPFNRAETVKAKSNLPVIGRSISLFQTLEETYREAMLPDVPTFDLDSMQGIAFDEWTYTDGLNSLLAFTQSNEINVRLALLAAEWDGPIKRDHALALVMQHVDKWQSRQLDRWALPDDYNVFFPPGSNRRGLVSRDAVTRAFDTDPRWLMKPHPVMSDQDIRPAVARFGILRVLDKQLSGGTLLRNASKVGYTTASELGIIAELMGKPTANFTLFEYEPRGRYYPIYRALRDVDGSSTEIINRLWNCPWSGFVHTWTPIEEARERFRAYRAKTIELREHFRPLITRPVPPLPVKEKQ